MRMELPDGTTVPTEFGEIEVGDCLGSRQFPSICGRALRTQAFSNRRRRCVIIETPFGRDDVLFEGLINVLGVAGLVI